MNVMVGNAKAFLHRCLCSLPLMKKSKINPEVVDER
jgi:hypothetical protein